MDKELQAVLSYLPTNIYKIMLENDIDNITEIRLRSGCNIVVINNKKINFLDATITQKELEDVLLKMCKYTMPAFEEELSNGYITLNGGHRVGVAGEYIKALNGKWTMRNVTSMNIRIAKNKLFNFSNQDISFSKGLLIVGPPHSGKTTALKTITQMLYKTNNIAICDERKELSIQNNNCDIMVGMSKVDAINIATRTLNPNIIICDEIGDYNEAVQILSSVNTGVKFICTAHSETYAELYKRPNIKMLIDANIFDKIIFLANFENNFVIKEILYV